MRFGSTIFAAATTVLPVLSVPSLASAGEPAQAGSLRLEAGGGVASRLGGPERQVMPSAHVGLGVRLSRRVELTGSLRHAFFPDLAEPYKEPVAYDDVTLGLRFTEPLGGVHLFLEPALVVAFWSEGNLAEVYDNTTPGAALHVGIEVPLADELSLGGSLGASGARGTEDFVVAFASAELHLGWCF